MTQPVVVFVHGAGGGEWEWDVWLNVFTTLGWDTLSGDLLPSDDGIANTAFDHYVDQVDEWLEQATRDQPPFVVGASLGGLLALAAAQRRPVSGLVLVNSVPPRGIGSWPPTRVRFPAVVNWSENHPVAETLAGMPDGNETLATAFPESWRNESGRVLEEAYNGVSIKRPNVPILVIVGASDEEIAPEYGRALAETYQADYMAFSQVSHLGALLGERAETVANLTAMWLESLVVEQEDLGLD